MYDPMAEAIIDKQTRANRRLYSSQDNEEMDRMSREQGRKREMVGLLKRDSQFRREVRKILNSQE